MEIYQPHNHNKYKKGDIIIAKKTLLMLNGDIFVKENKRYFINKIIIDSLNRETIHFESEYSKGRDIDTRISSFLVKKYFYTEKELQKLRKDKLLKINEI